MLGRLLTLRRQTAVLPWPRGVAFLLGLAGCGARATAHDPAAHDPGVAPDGNEQTHVAAPVDGAQRGEDIAPPPDAANATEPVAPVPGCECGQTGALQVLGCDVAQFRTSPKISEDGRTATFDRCIDGMSTCQPFVWRSDTGAQPLAADDASIVSLSPDGDLVLLLLRPERSSAEAQLYRHSDGSNVATGLRGLPVVLGNDGSVVGVTPSTTGGSNLLRWTRESGTEVLAELPLARTYLQLLASADAAVIAGYSTAAVAAPFRWSEERGLELGVDDSLDPARVDSISSFGADGASLAGLRWESDTDRAVYHWSDQRLVTIALANAETDAVLMSADGSVLAATLQRSPLPGCRFPDWLCSGAHAFRWTATATGRIQDLVPGTGSAAELLSRDGSVVIGLRAESDPGWFYWTEAAGARDIEVALAGAGADLTGWSLRSVTGVSRDGRVIVGGGTCSGVEAVFRAVLPE